MEEMPPPTDTNPAPEDSAGGSGDLAPIPGDTYPLRAELKALGAVWDRAARVWVIAPDRLALATALVENQGLLPAPQTAGELTDPFEDDSGPRLVTLEKGEGATYAARDALQAAGARFDKGRRAWVIREERAAYARAVLAATAAGGIAPPSATDETAPPPPAPAEDPAPTPPTRPPLRNAKSRGGFAQEAPPPPIPAPSAPAPPSQPHAPPPGMIRLGNLRLRRGADGRRYLEGNLSPTARILIFPNPEPGAGGEDAPSHVMYLAPVEADADRAGE